MDNLSIICSITVLPVLLFLLVFNLYAIYGRKVIRFNIVVLVNLIIAFILIGSAAMSYMG